MLVEEPAREHRAGARMSALSGFAFAVLLVVALVLFRQGPGLGMPDSTYARFYADGHGSVLVTAGLYVVPFAGITFLWHVSATRTLIDELPGPRSEVPRWLQVTSGVVFVCMMFAGSAAVGAVALLTVFSSTPLPPPDVARALSSAGYGLVFVFGVRAAGMYMIATTRLARVRGLLPRWLAGVSYLAATFLLVSTTFHPTILLVFPGWVVLLSVVLLLEARPTTPGPLPRPHTVPTPRAPEVHHDHDDRA